MKRGPGAITYGTVLRTSEVAGFILTETFHPPRLELPRHGHASANLNFVLRGSVREAFGRMSADCGPASVVVKPAGESHANRYGEAGARCLVLEVTPAQLEAARPFADVFDRPAHHPPGALTGLFRRIYGEFTRPDRATPLVLEGLILELIGTAARDAARGPAAPPPWLRRVEGLIRDRPAEAHTLSALAAAAGCHPSHLARAFRRCYGSSVGGYLRGLRLDAAARELAGTRTPLAEVAAAAGFYDQSHFTRAFKARFRMTPGAFRAAARGKEHPPAAH